LLTRVRGGEEVIDVGCGSGVLGLCALRLGAAGVSAVDMKADAVAATRRNAALNGLDDRLVAGDALPADPCDVVLANIARDGLVELADRLKVLVAPGGWLAASGISPAQCSLVAGYLRPLVEVERVVDGEWAVLVVARTFD
jgi:ribosomal protein L11 methyltransferase